MEQGERSKEHGARSKEQGERKKEQGARSKEKGKRSKEQGAMSKEKGERSKEIGARSKEKGARRKVKGARKVKQGEATQKNEKLCLFLTKLLKTKYDFLYYFFSCLGKDWWAGTDRLWSLFQLSNCFAMFFLKLFSPLVHSKFKTA